MDNIEASHICYTFLIDTNVGIGHLEREIVLIMSIISIAEFSPSESFALFDQLRF